MSRVAQKQIKVGYQKFSVNTEIYENSEQMVNDLTTRSITNSRFDNIQKRSFDDWEGVKTYDECLNYLRNGYQPVVEELKKSVKPSIKGESKRITFQNNVVGGNPIVPLAMIGVPNNMLDMQMKPIKSKVLDVYYDVTCPCTVNSEDIIKAGQIVLETIMKLEQQGYKFNLYAVQCYSDDRSADLLAIKIKSSNQPIDLKRMSYALTHTSFFRVLGFDWYTRFPKGKWRPSLGKPIATVLDYDTDKVNEFIRQIFGKNSMLLSGSIMHKNHRNSKDEYISRVITAK